MYIVNMDENFATATVYVGTHLVDCALQLTEGPNATHYGTVDKDGYCLLVRVDLLGTSAINWYQQIIDGEPK